VPVGAKRNSPEVHDLPVVEDEQAHLTDVFFAGVAWPNRVRFIRELRPLLGGLRVRTVLPHNESLRPANVGALEFEVEHRLGNRDLAILQNRSKVVLYLDRDFSTSGGVSRGTSPGPRLFETALAGAFQIAPQDSPGVFDQFERDAEIAACRSVADCAARIRHFLSHPVERRAMALAAQRRARVEHLYLHRAAAIARDVRTVLERKRPSVALERRPTILYVLHGSADQRAFGGTELHAEHSRRTLPHRYRSLAYYPDSQATGAKRMVVDRSRGGERGLRTVVALRQSVDPFAISDPEREHAFAQLLERERVSVVHFLHLMHHPPSLLEVARRHGVQTLVTFPDYHAVCPRFALLDAGNRFCWSSPQPLAACDIDLERASRIEFGSQARRRAAFGQLLALADAVTSLSHAEARILLDVYPELADRLEVVGWGIDAQPFAEVRSRIRRSEKLTVATVGNFTQMKGADDLLYLFNYFRRDSRVEFRILGRVDEPFDKILSELALPNVEIIGAYDARSLPGLLSDVDVGLLASVWAETYVLALSECWAAGVVPIVSDIGALGERVAHEKNGLKVPPASAGHLAAALARLLDDPGLLERLRSGAREAQVRSIEETTTDYVRIYDRLLASTGHADASLGDVVSVASLTLPSAFPRLSPRWGRTLDAGGALLSDGPPRPVRSAVARKASGAPEPAGALHGALPALVSIDPLGAHDATLGLPRRTSWTGDEGPARTAELFRDAAEWRLEGCVPESGQLGARDWLVSEGSDPQMASPELDLSWWDFDGLIVSMAAVSPAPVVAAQVFWTGTKRESFSEDLSFRFQVRGDGRLRRYIVRPQWTPEWRRHSSLRSLRLDPIDGRGSFLVSRIALFADRPRRPLTLLERWRRKGPET
jgi:glycosyltransferase involved in cell wall biosynthesis